MCENNNYFCKFTQEEVDILEEAMRIVHTHEGMLRILNLVEQDLGRFHRLTINLRGVVNEELNKLQNVEYTEEIWNKLSEDI